MRHFLGLLLLAAATAPSVFAQPASAQPTPAQTTSPQTWKTTADLADVDWGKATPAQKQAGLAVLRSTGCTCGCAMKLAQCRVEDPPCSQSKVLANMVSRAAAEGKSAAAMEKQVLSSDLAKRAMMRNRILWDPVAIETSGAPAKGAGSPKVILAEFSDFQCPYCTIAVGNLNAILKQYPKDVRLVFKQFPLSNHPQAKIAAQASLAAHVQGKFWEMHDKLYGNTRSINRANIGEWAKQIGLDLARFNADIDSQSIITAVEKEEAEGEKIGVEATPTVFVNGKKYMGSLEPAEFKKIIDAEIKNATSPRR